ncbi:pyrroline-5-carboxylate reductase 1, mitochondrial-like [Oppia nitens]|uniref:pyrroline-5-carboxylate reductase 1, mitochondrial-like n=1 Tax=Oppia nitens TaxID=1686743 RepID=UPI0023DC3A47|nr:pyrroline-5-carboxylate reductase 1, mitochondrial-like [Oppia nitens]XP_054156852.1 pyrroline-5-carboxylate reductase 1, mitochondrial-like [Oppia nitens]
MIGFIGAGKIAQSLMKGLVTAGISRADRILASAPKADFKCHQDTQSLGCRTTYDNKDVVNNSEIVILAVKPPVIPALLQEIHSNVSSNHLLISIALGIQIETYETALPANSRVVRVMSNTPVLIREGASVFSCGTKATKADAQTVRKLFTSVGMCEEIPESLIDAVTALSGSGPAYLYTCMEALADAGVLQGIPRDLSLKLVAQTLIGAARMVLETDKHPAALRDDVCSPAGCTIQAMYHLEKHGLRPLLMEAVAKATDVCKYNTKTNGYSVA